MITNITLENFKCFRHVSINPKRLTVLIGPNGTGKSSVLQALLLLKYRKVGINSFGEQKETSLLSDKVSTSPNFAQEPLNHVIDIDVSGSDEPAIEQIIALQKLRFVPSARGLVRGSYALRDDYEEQISLQRGLGIQEEQLATNLAYMKDMEEALSRQLERVTGTGIRTDVVPHHFVEVKSKTKNGLVNMVSEGFGTNALIQLLLQLISADKGATVLIEEPEIHLHPKAQADLAEVMAETAKAEDKQIIMTTHSEYVAGRLLTLVAEGKLTTDDLAIYSFEKDEKGECTATEIEVTERGQTKGGLTGFHEATRDEMRRYADGLRKHV